MRIISKFTDYYDSIQKIGYDPLLVFNRTDVAAFAEARMADKPFKDRCDKKVQELSSNNHNLRSFIGSITELSLTHPHFTYPISSIELGGVFFCGKCYNLLTHRNLNKISYLTNAEDFYDYIIGLSPKIAVKNSSNRWYMKGIERAYEAVLARSVKEIEDYFKTVIDLSEISREVMSPIFSFNYDCIRFRYSESVTWDFAPHLGDLNFSSILDPYTAYQEIAMYLGSTLATENNSPGITDNMVLRDSKGFDKLSFKKAPTKK